LRDSMDKTMDDYLSNSAGSLETVQVLSVKVDRNGVACDRRVGLSRTLPQFSDATANVEVLVVFSPGTIAGLNTDVFRQLPGVLSLEPVSISDKVTVSDSFDPTSGPQPSTKTTGDDTAKEEGEGGSEGMSVVVVAGAVAGGGALLLGLAACMFARSRNSGGDDAQVITGISMDRIDMAGLKASLTADV